MSAVGKKLRAVWAAMVRALREFLGADHCSICGAELGADDFGTVCRHCDLES